MISVVLGFHLCVSRRSLQLTLALVCLCWLGCFLLVSVGELIFDLFLTSSNNLTATVESNAATEKKEVLWPFRFPWYRMQVTKATEKKKPFRLIKRFCIQQPSGKLRVIDDAAAGGQSRLSQDGSKLDLCSAVQPGLNARLLWEAKTHLQGPESVLQDRLETGGLAAVN